MLYELLFMAFAKCKCVTRHLDYGSLQFPGAKPEKFAACTPLELQLLPHCLLCLLFALLNRTCHRHQVHSAVMHHLSRSFHGT